MPHPPELRALLAECRANPAEDLPRLVLADWLDERGEADRAQFIRLQLELAGMEWNSPGNDEKSLSAHALLNAHPEWNEGFGEKVVTSWSRGTRTIEEGREALLTAGFRKSLNSDEFDWVESVEFLYHRPESFVRHDFPDELLGRIDLTINYSTDKVNQMRLAEQFQLLAVSSNFAGVCGLEVLAGDNLKALTELTRADLTHLRKLKIEIPADKIAGASSLVASASFEKLITLDLGTLDETALKILIRSNDLPRLVELPLVGCPIGDGGIKALAESRLANQLTKLEFVDTNMTDAGLITIVNSSLMARLKRPRLILNSNQIGDTGLTALAQSEQLLNFTELALRNNQVGDEGIRALAESPYAILSIEGFDGFVTSTATPITSGWSDQLPGGTRTHRKPTPFTAH